MESQVVQVFSRRVYGVQKVYPANAAAQVAAQLVGAKTFNGAQLELLRDLGIRVEQVQDPQAVRL